MLGQFVIPKRKNGYIVGCCLLFSVSFFLALSPRSTQFLLSYTRLCEIESQISPRTFSATRNFFFYLIEQKNKES